MDDEKVIEALLIRVQALEVLLIELRKELEEIKNKPDTISKSE